MIQCTCLVQAERISPRQRATLQTRLDAFTTSNFGSGVDLSWIEVAKGSGYTAGRPSTSSFVSMIADVRLDHPERTAMLHDLCDFWAAETGCTLNEIMAVIADPRCD